MSAPKRKTPVLFIHTRADGFKRWVCVDTAPTLTAAREKVAELRQQDDPMWAGAEYLISDSRNPRADDASL